MYIVRAKLYAPGSDNRGTHWREAAVDDRGAGTVIFNVYKASRWTKFRLATMGNGRVLQENPIRPRDFESPDWSDDPEGISVEPGDVVTVDFVVHELAFRVRLNEDLDEEDEAVLALMKLQKRLGSTGLPGPPPG